MIEIIAPAGGEKNLDKLDSIKEVIKKLGFKVNCKSDLFADEPFSSNSLQYRLNHFEEAINSEADILLCYRGGYGSQHLIPHLVKLPKPRREKILIGYSDITALNLFLNKHWGWKTVHALGAKEAIRTEKSTENLQQLVTLLTAPQPYIELPLQDKLNDVTYAEGVSGEVIGGNLSMIIGGLATGWQIDVQGKILYLEDVNEAGYRVDRMLDHLWQANILTKVKALIFGDFSLKTFNDAEIALKRCALRADFPVYRTQYFGHGTFNYPIINGVVAEIIENKNKVLRMFLQPCHHFAV